MGFGDHLMAAGLAEELYARNPAAGPVTIRDLEGNPRWQPLWQGNPAIGVAAGPPEIMCGAGCLPYLVWPRVGAKLDFSPTYRAQDHRGHIYLTRAEAQRGLNARATFGDYVLVEPSPADRKNVNRAWPIDRWQRLVTMLQMTQPLPVLQFHHPHATRLQGIDGVDSPTFRDACGILASARLLICLEGGLAFAAAALGINAVVLWGGCVSAPCLSYPEHTNLVDDDPQTPCGSLTPCDHCTAAWQKLTPATVAVAVTQALALETV